MGHRPTGPRQPGSHPPLRPGHLGPGGGRRPPRGRACVVQAGVMRIEVVRDGALAERAAVWIAERVWHAVAERAVAHVAVSGGHTPAPMFDTLAGLPVPWTHVHIWQVDERVAPDGDPDRNLMALRRHLLDRLASSTLHAMDVAVSDLDAAARRYEEELQQATGGRFDVVHLGLGADGHTASWVPDDPAGEVDDRLVTVSRVYQGRRRLTLTVPA